MSRSNWADEPLDTTPIEQIDAQETRAERFWRHLPILGWGIASWLWDRRVRPIVAAYEKQLEARSDGYMALWGDDMERLCLVQKVSQITTEEMSWPNARFVPNDPVAVLFWDHADGLDSVSALRRIEDELRIKLPEGLTLGWFAGTYGEMIDGLEGMVR